MCAWRKVTACSLLKFRCSMSDPRKIRAAVIEDEFPAARMLASMLGRLRPGWEVIVIPGSVELAVEWFAANEHPDILFLDIQLVDGNSFMFISEARPSSVIVFTTAYDEYAVRAFSVNSIDYLLKPVSPERLEAALDKFERLALRDPSAYNESLHVEEVARGLAAGEGSKKRYRTRFLISANNRFTTLPVSDVSYFCSEDKITYAVDRNGRRHMLDLTLNRLEEELDPDIFFRVNRQFVLGVGAVRRMEPYDGSRMKVYVAGGPAEGISVSRDRVNSLKIWLDY